MLSRNTSAVQRISACNESVDQLVHDPEEDDSVYEGEFHFGLHIKSMYGRKKAPLNSGAFSMEGLLLTTQNQTHSIQQ